jgi:hypothetical protein
LKLKRKWARAVCVLLAMAMLFAFFPWVMYDLVGAEGSLWVYIGCCGTLICFVAALALRSRRLACPHCGRGMARPRWNPGKRDYCPNCGQSFVFDDEEA